MTSNNSDWQSSSLSPASTGDEPIFDRGTSLVAYPGTLPLDPEGSKNRAIRVLMLEDDDADAELAERALSEGGLKYRVRRVETRREFLTELEENPPDLILSDYALPLFDGISALELARERCPQIPFIFVTGTLGEEIAIQTLKNGATDYVLKTRLSRLVPAVNRALREAEERQERVRAEEKLRLSNEQLRTLTIHLQHVREEERTTISRRVHDELGQALTSLKFDLSVLVNRLPGSLKPLIEKGKAMSGQIDATIETVRRISTELRPGILDDLGLAAAIEWQAKEFSTRTGIKCDFVSMLEDVPPSGELDTAFFRIFQETLTNILRHARATRVEVRLDHEGRHWVLEVRDNGRGISPAEISSVKSIGLVGMRERAALLGGQMNITGSFGKGTAVTVRIPAPERPELDDRLPEIARRGRSGEFTPRLV